MTKTLYYYIPMLIPQLRTCPSTILLLLFLLGFLKLVIWIDTDIKNISRKNQNYSFFDVSKHGKWKLSNELEQKLSQTFCKFIVEFFHSQFYYILQISYWNCLNRAFWLNNMFSKASLVSLLNVIISALNCNSIVSSFAYHPVYHF